MAMYLFASRISAAVCIRSSPPSPTNAAPAPAHWPGRPSNSSSSHSVCLAQPRKAKPKKKVVLSVTTAEVSAGEGGSQAGGGKRHSTLHLQGDSQPPLVYDEGHLVSGTLEALVDLMVPTTASYPDRGFLFAFLLSSRLFLRPHELLAQVLAGCHAQQSACDKPSTAKDRLERILPPMVKLLEEWTDMFPYDFRDDRMTAAVRGIMQGCDCVPHVSERVGALLQTLLDRLTKLERFENQLAAMEAELVTNDRISLPATDVAEVCGSPRFLAQQLTGVELERMSYVGLEEFVLAFMRDQGHSHLQGRDVKKTNNLESYVAWSCHLSRLVATEICKGVKKLRMQMAEYWIETAKECFNIGNFNTLASILDGLNMAAVSRLSKTWSKTGSERLHVLRQAMHPGSDHENYRATLKAAVWRAQGNSSQNIVVPLFNLLVQDIYELTEPCSIMLPGNHVNMEAAWLLAKSLTEFTCWQQAVSPFSRCSKAFSYLQSSPVLSNKALMLASFECEAPETTKEKENYITLKVV